MFNYNSPIQAETSNNNIKILNYTPCPEKNKPINFYYNFYIAKILL